MNKRTAFILIGAAGAALDLLSKDVAFRVIPEDHPIDVIPGWLRWSRVLNPGIVWGLFPGGGRVFVLLSLVAVPLIVLLYWRTPRPGWLFTTALGLVLAGAVGNLYDRWVIGKVRDFIDVYAINYPVFNVADSMICVGVGCLAWQMCFEPPRAAGQSTGGAPPDGGSSVRREDG